MSIVVNQKLNQQIVNDFVNGKSIIQLAEETNLDTSYITLVLDQEGIHYSNKDTRSYLPGTNGSQSSTSWMRTDFS